MRLPPPEETSLAGLGLVPILRLYLVVAKHPRNQTAATPQEGQMSEHALWSLMRDKLKDEGGHWHRVENLLDRGTPDVDWACWGREGWIELKELPAWPKRPGTVVRIDHYSDDQRQWIRTRGEAGGKVHLLLRIARPRTYLLFGWRFASSKLGRVTRDVVEQEALVTSGPNFPLVELRDALSI